MEDHGGMRLARLDDRGRQDHHRHDHARPARRPEGQSQGLHLEEGSGFDAAILIDKDKGIAFDFNDNKERKRK